MNHVHSSLIFKDKILETTQTFGIMAILSTILMK